MKQKHTKYTQINTNKSTHSEMGPVWQNPTQRTVRTALQVCLWLCTASVHNTTHDLIARYKGTLLLLLAVVVITITMITVAIYHDHSSKLVCSWTK